MYCVAQLLGAVIGAAVVYSVADTDKLGQYLCTPVPLVSLGEVFGCELTITFVLVLMFFASADIGRSESGAMGPLAIGLTVTVCHLWTVRILAVCFIAVGSFCILVFVVLTLLSFYRAMHYSDCMSSVRPSVCP